MTQYRLKKLFILSICALFLTSGINATLLGKIKKAANNVVKQTKETFNKMVHKSKKNLGKNENSKENFYKALANPDEVNIKGLDIYERRFEKQCEVYDKFLAELVWIDKSVFIKQLEQAKTESKDKARLLLHDKIVLKYPNSKTSFITFAADLNKEWQAAGKLIDELLDFKQKIKEFKDVENKTALEKLLEEFTNLDLDAKKLGEIVCDLII
jgi:hypothetical protein